MKSDEKIIVSIGVILIAIIIMLFVIFSCAYELDVPETFDVQMDCYENCIEFQPCEGVTYRHYSRDYCVSCLQCIDGYWQEIWCADYPWEEE